MAKLSHHRGAPGRGVQHRPLTEERSAVHPHQRLRRKLHRGCQDKMTGFDPHHQAGQLGWDLWKRSPHRSNPSATQFCSDPELSAGRAPPSPLDDKIPQYIQKICKRDPSAVTPVTGIVTVKDSSWLLSWTLNRRSSSAIKPRISCVSGSPRPVQRQARRLCQKAHARLRSRDLHRWLYHIGVPTDQIEELAELCITPCRVMPYIDAFFMPVRSDRPDIVPEGAVNLPSWASLRRPSAIPFSTTEYSRAPVWRPCTPTLLTWTAVCRGLGQHTCDVRDLLNAAVKLRDDKKITDMDLPLIRVWPGSPEEGGGHGSGKLLQEYNAI